MKLLLPVLDLLFPFELTSSSSVLNLGDSNCFQFLRPSLCIDATSQVNETTLHCNFPVTRNAKQLWDHTSTSQYDCQLHKQYMTTLNAETDALCHYLLQNTFHLLWRNFWLKGNPFRQFQLCFLCPSPMPKHRHPGHILSFPTEHPIGFL